MDADNLTVDDIKKMMEKVEKNRMDINQLLDMVEYAAQSNEQVRNWLQDWKNGIYH